MREIKKLYLNLNKSMRIIISSDIHGGIDLLKSNLNRLNYNPKNDYLFILGDMINRGINSLKTINECIELSKVENVYIIKGNHEEDFYNRNDLQRNLIKMYADKDTSLLHELLANTDYKNMNEDEMFDYAYNNYKYIFDFINSLPDMIETDDYIMLHAAYFDEIDIKKIIRTPDYLKDNYYSKDKLIIVGHYPTGNYPTYIKNNSNFVYEFKNTNELLNEIPHKFFYTNPIYLKENKIIMIDGGKGVKDFGQLNSLIIENNTFKYISSDNCKTVEVKHDQEEKGSIAITYKDCKIDIVKIEDELTTCYFHDELIQVETRLLRFNEETREYTTWNNSNYFLPLKKGDKVKLIYKNKTISQIKKDGIVGYAYNTNLFD